MSELLDRRKIIAQAILECFREMYRKSQPVGDYDEYLKLYNEGKITKEDKVYDRHYLSCDEYTYIIDKYIDAYKLKDGWFDHFDLLEKYLKEGGTKDKYIDGYTDETGFHHPGYRGYEDVPSITDQFKEVLSDDKYKDVPDKDELIKNLLNHVFTTMDYCKHFYRFNQEETEFRMALAMGASPTGSKKAVKEYWAEQGKEIEFEDRNPLLFWDVEYYGDSLDEVMEDEYGKDWKAVMDKKWKEEKAEKERKAKEAYEALVKKMAEEEEEKKKAAAENAKDSESENN